MKTTTRCSGAEAWARSIAGVMVIALLMTAGLAGSGHAAPAVPATGNVPLLAAAPTLPMAAAGDVPEADVVSVDFAADGPVEHVRGRDVSVVGAAPDVDYDETVQRHVAKFAADEAKPSTGTGGYLYDIADAWSHGPDEVGADLLDGGTFECYFRYDGDNPVPAGQASQLCVGGPQGYGFYLPATGCCLRFKATATTANKNTATAPVPTRTGEWVHAVATVGDGDIKLYLNGVPATEIPQEPGNAVGTGRNHAGPYTNLNVDEVGAWGIGAAPTADGFTQPANIAVAASRVWSAVLTPEQVAALWRQERPAAPDVDVPSADILDVDFSDVDHPFRDLSPSDREAKVTGSADITPSSVFATQPHHVYTTDGEKDHVFYPLQDAWADTGMPRTDEIATWADDTWAGDGITLQCDVRFNGELPATGSPHFCAGKSAGGFGMHVDGSKIVATFHLNGGYKTVTSPAIAAGVWHSVVATYDGAKVALYLDGELVDTNTTNTSGPIKAPTAGSIIEPYVRYYAIGSDVKGHGAVETPAPVSVGTARVWSTALDAEQAAQLHQDSFGDSITAIELTSSSPAAGDVVTSPVEFDVVIGHQEQATGWRYELDGTAIRPGEVIGSGMAAGQHEIVVTATDVFGRPVHWTIPFSSVRIPSGGGTDTKQGSGTVSISAIATGPGSEVTTTFKKAARTAASGGVQGTVAQSPANLGLHFDDQIEDRAEISGPLTAGDGETVATPASHDRFPFQRFDVEVPNADAGQQVLWSGVVDPARAANLWVWDNNHDTWVLLAQARGEATGDTRLQGALRPRMIDTTDADRPVVHVLVTAEDPFVDDLSPRDSSAGAPDVKDRFEDPDDYQFSFVHYTDQQYTTEAASGSQMEWPSSLPWQHLDGATNTPEEASVFEHSLRVQNEWIAANKDDRKIKYVANTGDVINSHVSGNDVRFDPDAIDPGDGTSVYDYTTSDGAVPGAKEQVKNEFLAIRSVQEALWNSGLPNQMIAGNHDNRSGTHNGPLSPFAAFFDATTYYDQAAGAWPADASYHTMDEVTDAETGAVVSRGADNSNNYVLFSAGGLDFVAVGLSYGVTQEESDWADAVFKRYSDRNGILITHGYLSASAEPDGRGAKLGADGSKLYDEVVRTNDNVFLVLGGHFHGIGTNVDAIPGAKVSNKVVQLLADYQGYMAPAAIVFTKERCEAAGLDPSTQCVMGTGEDAGKIDVDGDGTWEHRASDKLALGASYLRMLQFDTEANTMSVDTYSPFLDEFGATRYDHGNSPKTTPEPIKRYNGAEDNFTVPVNLTTRTTSFVSDGLAVITPTAEVIGEQTVKSGFPATVEWAGLTEGETYAWVATSTLAGEESGVVDQFGGVFVASAAGTDTTPPTLTIPAAATIAVGRPSTRAAG
ncbi:LamG-like jellyroll fold domain-containing protein [Nocardioides alcanivorans]|uniref:LamG-like jellyroll fold domain-containing protein n=1 Tax=Nocardioides alcanivorans TaxID=2897352 RepID=UPI001F44E488|nr:LamG-like jellyroll fold domain-containing protein [Nocardioides alcanivorans]